MENFKEEHEKNSHHIYKNAEDSTKKHNAETTVVFGYKADEIKENDVWIPNLGKGQNRHQKHHQSRDL